MIGKQTEDYRHATCERFHQITFIYKRCRERMYSQSGQHLGYHFSHRNTGTDVQGFAGRATAALSMLELRKFEIHDRQGHCRSAHGRTRSTRFPVGERESRVLKL